MNLSLIDKNLYISSKQSLDEKGITVPGIGLLTKVQGKIIPTTTRTPKENIRVENGKTYFRPLKEKKEESSSDIFPDVGANPETKIKGEEGEAEILTVFPNGLKYNLVQMLMQDKTLIQNIFLTNETTRSLNEIESLTIELEGTHLRIKPQDLPSYVTVNHPIASGKLVLDKIEYQLIVTLDGQWTILKMGTYLYPDREIYPGEVLIMGKDGVPNYKLKINSVIRAPMGIPAKLDFHEDLEVKSVKIENGFLIAEIDNKTDSGLNL